MTASAVRGLGVVGLLLLRDAGHALSGSGVQRVLTELRRLSERMASRATEMATPARSKLDDLRARRAARLTDAQNREHPLTGD